ncbi:glycerol-3-phosphate dehydrogenase, partial [Rhizophlyctis rosea]
DDQSYYYTQGRSNFTASELELFGREFQELDGDGDGVIGVGDLRRVLERVGLRVGEGEVEEVLGEVDLDRSGGVEFREFLEVLAAVKEIRSRSRFARILAAYEDKEKREKGRGGLERSGGGV